MSGAGAKVRGMQARGHKKGSIARAKEGFNSKASFPKTYIHNTRQVVFFYKCVANFVIWVGFEPMSHS